LVAVHQPPPQRASGTLTVVKTMNKLIVTGPQGSGKGTQAVLLEKRCDLVHISVGDMLRWNVHNHTQLGAHVQRTLAAGMLLPDEVVEQLVRERLDQHDWNFGFVLDGFPRTEAQAVFLLERYHVDAAIYLDVHDDVVLRRALARRVCSRCGQDYNLISHQPVRTDVCDICGGALVAREDDTPGALRLRLAEYHRQTEPMLAFLRTRKPVFFLDGDRPPEEVYAEICEKTGLLSPVDFASRNGATVPHVGAQVAAP
jgi:adenylate kinase